MFMEGKSFPIPRQEKLSQMRKGKEDCDDNYEHLPVSPTGQFFNSSTLSVYILAVFELETVVEDLQGSVELLRGRFLPINPRFSSIMVRDEEGRRYWKPVNVTIGDHVKIPRFPPGLSSQEYEKHLQDYVSEIGLEELSQSKPLWEIHLFRYPTPNAASTVLYKIHHAIGDGFSLMTALFSSLQRADDPSLPLTFPRPRGSSRRGGHPHYSRIGKNPGVFGSVVWRHYFSPLWFTVKDFGWSLLKSSWLVDSKSPIRSGDHGLEYRPISVSSVVFGLDDIRKVKEKLKATVNDVIVGTIFYGLRLYMHRMSEGSEKADVTALVLLSTRSIASSATLTLQDISQRGSESPWGNQFGFLHVPLPACKQPIDKANPVNYVFEAQEMIRKKKNSLGVYLNGILLEILRKLKGPEAAAQYIHSTLTNASLTISNMVGPMEKITMGDHPVKSFYFMVTRAPQSLTVTMVSYNGQLRVAIGAEQGFIDAETLIGCFRESFAKIVDATLPKT